MTKGILKDRRILVIEDEYFIASDVISALECAGVTVFGPVSDVERAMEIAAAGFPLDGAVVDINLHGEMVYPAAASLAERMIPVFFVTGYGRESIPEMFSKAPCLAKPVDHQQLVELLARHLTIGQL